MKPATRPRCSEPAHGLAFDPAAVAIVKLLIGEHTIEAIVDRIARVVPGADRRRLRREVEGFVDALAARCLLERP